MPGLDPGIHDFLPLAMSAKKHIIELDEATATTLESRAAERGLSVSDLVAEMAANQLAPVVVPPEELAELDRQWEAIKAGERTVPHEDVVRWLRTWGKPDFKPWRDQ